LTEVKRLIRRAENRRITRSALDGAAALGLTDEDVVACVLGLTSADFYKSMPALINRSLWQDVYRPRYAGLPLYVKVQIIDGKIAVVISFKAL
jgi:motility quorum-sensing regulator/GCU-specific mRNA interferase toxin